MKVLRDWIWWINFFLLPHCLEHAEADTFFCFTNLMSENRDNFIKSLDDSQCGITYKMESVYSMLKEKDLELYLKLVQYLCSYCMWLECKSTSSTQTIPLTTHCHIFSWTIVTSLFYCNNSTNSGPLLSTLCLANTTNCVLVKNNLSSPHRYDFFRLIPINLKKIILLNILSYLMPERPWSVSGTDTTV